MLISQSNSSHLALFHLPGLFEFYELYKVFLPLFYKQREYFYDFCDIGSIYGAPGDCLWGGGRVGFGDADPRDVLDLMKEYNISARLTFSNSFLRQEHLSDKKCNRLLELFSSNVSNVKNKQSALLSDIDGANDTKNGIIIYSDLLLDYIKKNYPEYYFVSSTTKVITDFDEFIKELDREEYSYVVADFRLNKRIDSLIGLTTSQKDKVEFLCNECCNIACTDRKACYESVSRKSLSEDMDGYEEHVCKSKDAKEGYVFSKAMQNPAFIGIDDIKNTYLPMGFTNFKIEGRSLGSAIVLEFLLYYLTKPEYQLNVREKIYLDSSLDLF